MFLNTQNYTSKSPLLMTPGPVLLPSQITDALHLPLIHHRTKAFEADLDYVLKNLPLIFKTKQKVYLHTSTGSGAMESAIVNTLSPGDKVLCIVTGKFGERWMEMSKAFGLNPIEYKVTWGKSFIVEEVKNIFLKNPDLKAVMIQACETSTGALNPVRELGQFLKEKNCLLIVDAITALGATTLNMDDWHLDVVLGGSQKAFMLPTGLSMISFSKKAWEFIHSSKLPKYYWDIRREDKANASLQTYFSSSVTLVRALKTAIEIILNIGPSEFIERHEIIAQAIRTGGEHLNLKVFADHPSSTVTAFLLPEGINGEKVQKIMQEKHFITIAGGQNELKGKIIRIGHMGAIEREHILHTLKALGETLSELGHSVDFQKAIEETKKKLTKLTPLPKI